MNNEILNIAVQQFIDSHLNADISKLLLGKSLFPGISTKELVQQIDGKRRSEKKLPTWFKTPGIYYPPKLNIEQASSELTAEYKSRLVQGNSLADLTGGFGIDDYFFSQKAEKVYHLEMNEELSIIAKHNASVLNTNNIMFIIADSIRFLRHTELSFDTIYIDPARRVESKKVFLLKDTEPDVVSALPLLLSKAKRIIIKTSPLFDIQSGLSELHSVSAIHVVSVKNDCKELLWVIDRDFEGEPDMICCAIAEEEKRYTFRLSDEKRLVHSKYSQPKAFLYEPDVSILKAGAFKSVVDFFKIEKLNPNTHLYTSANFVEDFVGRVFEIQQYSSYKSFTRENNIEKANIISRNFPLSVDEIKKKHKLQDGGDYYLIFCKGPNNDLLAVTATRCQ